MSSNQSESVTHKTHIDPPLTMIPLYPKNIRLQAKLQRNDGVKAVETYPHFQNVSKMSNPALQFKQGQNNQCITVFAIVLP